MMVVLGAPTKEGVTMWVAYALLSIQTIPLIIGATLIPLSLLIGTAILIFVFCRKRRAKQQKSQPLDIPLIASNDNYTNPVNCQESPASFNALEKTEDTIKGRVFRKPYRCFPGKKLPPTPTECEKLGNMEGNSVYEDIDNNVYLEPKLTNEYSQLPLPPLPQSNRN
ncbi:hypothetical protein ACTXT7_014450 [Hymenolepis weldensis]